ncbi:p-hydroxyphenylacetate 3-hydroxylase, reductase component [Pseudovibrio sp. Ad46]|uniref:flavin reductase n=1 Tax=Pseudovibrio sp. Ad46 TaxID=989432 RepID=UPI0007AE5883|nr:flavin reductase [Pseudovibrio sp. Ad46]KZK90320.1 p-hydroxyphenylacetate 3-hydroxylase, reductase component [Pseudovibrio sp. Ad46]
MTAMDPRTLRNAFGTFLTGVTVVTAHGQDGEPLGFTANSFSSVSLDPPLLLVCLAKSSSNYDALTEASGFAVNILAETQKDVSNTFASRVEDRFATVDWKVGPNGSPVLSDVAAWFDCSMHNVVDAGDHAILIGEVKAFETGVANGLGYARGAYFTATQEVSSIQVDSETVVSALLERDKKVLFFEDDAGQLRLPTRNVSKGTPTKELTALLEEVGVPSSVGFIYSVYEDEEANAQHLAFHCSAGEGASQSGTFLALTDDVLARVQDAATQKMLGRFAKETQKGNFGIYFGNHENGEVRKIALGE